MMFPSQAWASIPSRTKLPTGSILFNGAIVVIKSKGNKKKSSNFHGAEIKANLIRLKKVKIIQKINPTVLVLKFKFPKESKFQFTLIV